MLLAGPENQNLKPKTKQKYWIKSKVKKTPKVLKKTKTKKTRLWGPPAQPPSVIVWLVPGIKSLKEETGWEDGGARWSEWPSLQEEKEGVCGPFTVILKRKRGGRREETWASQPRCPGGSMGGAVRERPGGSWCSCVSATPGTACMCRYAFRGILPASHHLKEWLTVPSPKIFFFFGLFVFSRAPPTAYGGSQAWGPIGSVATSLCHSNLGSKPRLWPTPQLTAMPDP